MSLSTSLLLALLMLGPLAGCAAPPEQETPPIPAPVVDEPMCGFVKRDLFCCVQERAPMLEVRCTGSPKPERERPKQPNPNRET